MTTDDQIEEMIRRFSVAVMFGSIDDRKEKADVIRAAIVNACAENRIYGIIDPDYGRVYTIARKLAWEEGYAIGLHGSFTRDLDLVAIPWAERACEPEHLVRRIEQASGLKLLKQDPGGKPHGRLAWTLLFPAFGDPRFVDFSVMPRLQKAPVDDA